MTRKLRALLLSVPLLASPLTAQTPAGSGTLDIYFIDVEGGQATLYVTPNGESVLVDTGNPGARDTDRIVSALAAAGVKQIDHLLLTHYHGDHAGGVEELSKRIPIRHFIDHGPPAESTEQMQQFERRYAEVRGQARRTIARPGDRIPVGGLDWRIVGSAGQVIRTPLPGAGAANPSCALLTPRDNPRDLENPQSVGSVIRYGNFRTINLGDMLFGQELALMCPMNRIGRVDLYLTSHHGVATSGSEALVHALRPRVAIMNNGTRKGGSVQTLRVLHASPGLEDLWQLHWSYHGGVDQNAPGVFIANLDEPAALATVLTALGPGSPPGTHDGPAHLIKVSARADGSFTVTNTRNGFSKSYGR